MKQRAWPGLGAQTSLTVGLWLSATAVFGLSGAVMERQFEAWLLGWLAGLSLGGIALSLMLARLIGVFETLPRWAGWPLLGGAVVAAALSQAVLDIWVLRWAQQLGGAPLAGNVSYAVYLNFLSYLWLFALYATLVKLQRAHARERRQETQLLEARAAGDRARLEALRYQVNPHFLFNTLNGLQTLISADRKAEALSMVRHLSSFLRSSLAHEADDLSPLAAELDALEGYLEVERARFGDRLQIAIDCPETLGDVGVPHLVLQPLVENVMTHVVARSTGSVRIEIRCHADGDDLVLDVADSGAAHAPQVDGLGIGLSNVRDRLKLLFGDRGALEAGPCGEGFRVRIRQPLRTAAP